jgi:SNF2 family DNA or RNA helicase
MIFKKMIVDEAVFAKNTATARFKILRKICNEVEHLVLLSGTPLMNGAAELYAPLLLIGHPLAGDGTVKARMAFESIFAGGHRRKIRNTGVWFKDYVWWAKGANNTRELRYLLRDHFFFKRKEDTSVFKHRPNRQIIDVPMTIPWLAEYNQAWEDYLVKAKKRNVDMENVMELQALIENGQTYQVNSKWKARQVVDDIKNGVYGDQRIVVFSMFIETYTLIAALLAAQGISYRVFEDVREWKTGTEQVILGRIKAHGKGTNLSEASVALFVDMDFVPANNIQAENRIDRPEQTKPMTIRYYLTEGNDVVDAHVRNINKDKQRKIDEFMRPLTPEEIAGMPAQVEALIEKYRKHFAVLGYPQPTLAPVHE